MQNLLSKGT